MRKSVVGASREVGSGGEGGGERWCPLQGLVRGCGAGVELWGGCIQSWLLRGAAGGLLGELESNHSLFRSAVPPPLLWKLVISLIPLHTSPVLLFSSLNSSSLL